MSRNLILTTLACVTLGACGTPQEQCIARNTGEYRAVSSLLADVEGNLARGYAWETREVVRTEWDTCSAVIRDREGRAQVITRPCLRDVVDSERYRVPIDPAAEKRKRDNLAARQKLLGDHARKAQAACRAAYPEQPRR